RLNLEKIRKMKTRKGNPLYSIRITLPFRAVISIEGDYLRFISFIILSVPYEFWMPDQVRHDVRTLDSQVI
ncbi:MAG TPA: hypothetical protein DDW42_00120, partial [Desulfobacteraceae bacterium]|nr:hypothetical protein [Desulfobacteraceae bacterium]